MTYQKQDKPKAEFLCRLTHENYDFLYRLSRTRDVSLAKALNELISGIRNCNPKNTELIMRGETYV